MDVVPVWAWGKGDERVGRSGEEGEEEGVEGEWGVEAGGEVFLRWTKAKGVASVSFHRH